MELPRIPKEQLSQELREVVGDNDPSDIFDISFNPHTYEQGTRDIGKKLIELREQNELHGRSSKERYKENS